MSTPQPNPETTALFNSAVEQLEAAARLCKLDESQIQKRENAVSGWTVLQHLEHVTIINSLLLIRVSKLLSEPPSSEGGLNEIGISILANGQIPRGAGKSPEFALPKASSAADVKEQADSALSQIESLKARLHEIEVSQSRSQHPALGTLTAREWLRFIEIHTRHHLTIIREINGPQSL